MTNLNMTIISRGWRLCLEYPSSLFVCLFRCLSFTFLGLYTLYSNHVTPSCDIYVTDEAY